MIFLHFLKCFPRQCGGQPIAQPYTPEVRVFPASAGGSTLNITKSSVTPGVFPASAGVNLRCTCMMVICCRFPRQCGDQPVEPRWAHL